MANNFYNAIKTSISADSTLPTAVYTTPASKKAILIELDVANKSSSGVTVSVQICDASANTGPSGNTRNVNAVATNTTGTLTTVSAHGLLVNDRVTFTNAAGSTNYAVKFVSPGDTLLDFGSTQGFAAAMSVALG